MLQRIYATALLLILSLVLVSIKPSAASTLHERSLQVLEERLTKADPDDYRFVVLGDSRNGDEVFAQLLKKAVARKPLFILHLGDVSDRGSDPELEHFLSLVDRHAAGLPLFVAKGNHEKGKGFTKLVGPKNYTLVSDRLNLLIAVADNSRRELTAQQLIRLRNELQKPYKTRIVAMHFYPKTTRQPNHVFEKGRNGYLELLRDLQPSLSLHGDIHLYDHEMIEGVPAYISGGAGAPLAWIGYEGQPRYHFLVIRVKKGRASVELVPLE